MWMPLQKWRIWIVYPNYWPAVICFLVFLLNGGFSFYFHKAYQEETDQEYLTQRRIYIVFTICWLLIAADCLLSAK